MVLTVLQAAIQLQFNNYWHCGSGRGSGSLVDAVCERDGEGLPYVPGRQLKGILRHAVRRAEAWGWLDAIKLPSGPLRSHEELLFGSKSQDVGKFMTYPGMLLVDNGKLPEADRAWLNRPHMMALKEQFFEELYSTAINEMGTAKAHSLRGIEVCLPVTLQAQLALQVTALDSLQRQQQQDWMEVSSPWKALRTALPLIDALGAHRSRGLGEAEVSFVTTTGR